MTEPSVAPLPPETVSALITTALRARQRGDHAAARSVLRALTMRAPDTTRVWLALAAVAETRDEQRQALERVIALDPQHPLARRGLAQLEAHQAPVTAPLAETPSEPLTSDEPTIVPAVTFAPSNDEIEDIPPEPEREIRWPLYALLGAAAAIILVALLFFRPWERPSVTANGDTSTAPLGAVISASSVATTVLSTETSADVTVLPTTSSDQPTSAPNAPTANTSGQPTSAPTGEAQPASDSDSTPAITTQPPSGAQSTETAVSTPQTTLTPGTIVKNGDWHASLLFPDQAVLLDGSIGTLQPRGRFVLALITLGNDGITTTKIPATLFSLVDNRGNRYQAQPDASTAYLATYGRGQRGDLSMEDAIPTGGDNVSIPLIFDVPTDARGLTLRVGASPQGWPIGGQ